MSGAVSLVAVPDKKTKGANMKETINIYLTQEHRKQIDKIRQKYKVSLTTIADKLTFITYYCMIHYGIRENLNAEMLNEYFQKGNAKTSIKKPHCLKERELMQTLIQENPSRYITNALILYITKDIKFYLNSEGLNYYWNKIDQELQKVQEQYYDYNRFVRASRRNLKENKDYYKKAISEMEQK